MSASLYGIGEYSNYDIPRSTTISGANSFMSLQEGDKVCKVIGSKVKELTIKHIKPCRGGYKITFTERGESILLDCSASGNLTYQRGGHYCTDLNALKTHYIKQYERDIERYKSQIEACQRELEFYRNL